MKKESECDHIFLFESTNYECGSLYRESAPLPKGSFLHVDEIIPFNYCPQCGKKLEQKDFTNQASKITKIEDYDIR